MYKALLPIIAISVLTFSCGTSNKYMADDIYVLKPSELAVGESSADETTYSAFKKRKQGDVSDKQIYADDQAVRRYQDCINMPRWRSDCGCSYSDWARQSPFSTRYYNYGMMGYNYMLYPSYGMSPYMGYGGFGGYSHIYYGNMYGYYNPYYSNYGGFGYGYGYGSGYGGYGYGGNGYGGNYYTSNGGTSSNVYNGPRGSGAGYANPHGRNYTNKIKSASANPSVVGKNTPITNAPGQRITTKPITEINEIQRASRGITTPSGRPAQTTSSGSHQYANSGRVGYSSNAPSARPSTSGNTINRTNTDAPVNRSSSGTIGTPSGSRSSGGSVSGGSSSGGSRSGGSTSSGGSSGRRP